MPFCLNPACRHAVDPEFGFCPDCGFDNRDPRHHGKRVVRCPHNFVVDKPHCTGCGILRSKAEATPWSLRIAGQSLRRFFLRVAARWRPLGKIDGVVSVHDYRATANWALPFFFLVFGALGWIGTEVSFMLEYKIKGTLGLALLMGLAWGSSQREKVVLTATEVIWIGMFGQLKVRSALSHVWQVESQHFVTDGTEFWKFLVRTRSGDIRFTSCISNSGALYTALKDASHARYSTVAPIGALV